MDIFFFKSIILSVVNGRDVRHHAIILVNNLIVNKALRDCSFWLMDGTFRVVPRQPVLNLRSSQVIHLLMYNIVLDTVKN